MEVMERDPAYIAQQLKFLRKTFRFTQENLADAAGLTVRTIEKLESGRHRPEEQTLRSLARAFKLDVKYFEKPTPEEEARQRAAIAIKIDEQLASDPRYAATGLPRDLLHKIGFMAMKENFGRFVANGLPYMKLALDQFAEHAPEQLRIGHNKALAQGLAPDARAAALSAFHWVVRASNLDWWSEPSRKLQTPIPLSCQRATNPTVISVRAIRNFGCSIL